MIAPHTPGPRGPDAMSKPEILPVLFRMGRGECVAVFPTLDGRGDPNRDGTSLVTCYAHIGQHGEASRGWYRTARPATPEEIAPLLRELQGIYGRSHAPGDPVYSLKVIQRWPKGA